MTYKRASRLEKKYRVVIVAILVATISALVIYGANRNILAIRTADNIAEVVDCDSIIKKSSLYNANNNLGSLGVFGVIGFSEADSSNNTTGIATNYLKGNNTPNGQGNSVLVYANSMSNGALGWNANFSGDDSRLVVGSSVPISIGQWSSNNQISISGTNLPITSYYSGDMSTIQSATTHIYREQDQKFIDLAALKESASTISAALAQTYSTNQNVTTTSAQTWEEMQINVSGSGTAVANIRARNNGWEGGYKVNNLSAGQTLIVNFDMTGFNSTEINNFTASSNNGNIIFNVIDSSKSDKLYTGNIKFNNEAHGFIIAPKANVEISNKLTGNVVANIAKASNTASRPFQGNFPVEVPAENFGVCDDGGEAPVGQHKLTVNHYVQGESDPFDTTFQMIDDGAAYTAEPVSASYYELIGAKAGSNPISGTITEDLVVDLEYRVKDVTFTIEHRSTENGNPLIESEQVTTNALTRYTVKAKSYDDYKYERASASLTQLAKDFGESITLYYRPWVDPASPVTEDMVYENTDYYVESRLGSMGGFHLIGFSEIDANVRVFGNILTEKVSNMNEFGLVHFDVISFTREVGGGITNPKFSPNDTVNTVLVVGKDVDIDLADGGDRWAINGAKVDIPQRRKNTNPSNLWREKDVPFVDLNKMQADAINFSKSLAEYDEDLNIEKDFHDMNNKVITVKDDEGLNVVNLTHNDFDDSHDIFIEGFDKEKQATLVINIDMAGYQGDFNFAGTRLRWAPDDVYNETFTGGENISREDAILKNTITLNFIDSSSEDGLYHGRAISSRPMVAFVLIPEGTFTIQSSSFAGAVVANRVTGNGNSYMVLFDHANYSPDDPDPDPDPTPDPTPDPDPEPEPDPTPTPTPEPEPDPTPEPEPEPIPEAPSTFDGIAGYAVIASAAIAASAVIIAKKRR